MAALQVQVKCVRAGFTGIRAVESGGASAECKPPMSSMWATSFHGGLGCKSGSLKSFASPQESSLVYNLHCDRFVRLKSRRTRAAADGQVTSFGAGGTDGPSGSGGGRGGGGHGGGGGGGGGGGSEDSGSSSPKGGVLGAFAQGWQDRVNADPQFVFKVLTEQVIGVGACLVGDMASRPNWGLNELDFVFSTLIVGSILNFSLMYMLAPTVAGTRGLPGIFAACPAGHMFESGAFTLAQRAGTLVYKGVQFAAVGFAAGIVGTSSSTLLLKVRKSLQPNFVLQNEPPDTILNATAWALHMGISSNLRYQGLNGLEAILVQMMNANVFRALSMAMRLGNNVLGGVSFVTLARITGSQKSSSSDSAASKKEATLATQH